jgi:LacI family transcriptional regulator
LGDSRANLADVAKLAGVSLATASRVVSGTTYPVTKTTRERVLSAVRELRYTPSALARALATSRSHIIGVIVGDVGDPYFAELVRGVEDVARRAGYLVIVCNADRDPATEIAYLGTLLDYRVDGVVFAGGGLIAPDFQQSLAESVARLEQSGAVVLALAPVAVDVPIVSIDNRSGSVDMIRHLQALGHRRIGVIGGPRTLTTARDRLEGVREARGDSAILIVESDFTARGGHESANELLASSERPTAIFALNDQMAIGALTAAHERGISVPGSLTVVGYGDTAPARQTWPPLSSVVVPRHEMGATGMRAILARLGGAERVSSQVLPHRIAIRGSCGPPAGPS